MEVELEFIDIKEDKVIIHYSMEEKWHKILSLPAPSIESSQRLHKIICEKLNKRFNFNKDSLRLLITERQGNDYESFVMYDDCIRSIQYYSPMFTKQEQVFIKLLKQYCLKTVNQHIINQS